MFIPLELDKMKDFKYYFPKNNFKAIFNPKIKILKLFTKKFSFKKLDRKISIKQ